MRLTDEHIRKAKRPASGQTLLWDDLVQGFGCRITPTKTSFVVQWRENEHRKPRESLQPHWPALDAVQARELARKRLSEVVAVQGTPGSQPLRSAIRRWHSRQMELGIWSASYAKKVDYIISHYFEGVPNPRITLNAGARAAMQALGNKAVGHVTRAEALQLVKALKPSIGAEVMAIASSCYGTLRNEGVECQNPFDKRGKVTGGKHKRTRLLSEAEFLKLWHAAQKEDGPTAGAFAVLAFTGCRRREATQMRWSELDLTRSSWTLPPERRKNGRTDPTNFVIALHPWLRDLLKGQDRLQGNPHVFWGRRDQGAFEFHHATRQRLDAAGVENWRLHDLRRFARGGMARLGVTQMVAELCLGHTAKSALVETYDAHDYADEKAAAWHKWGAYLVKITGRAAS